MENYNGSIILSLLKLWLFDPIVQQPLSLRNWHLSPVLYREHRAITGDSARQDWPIEKGTTSAQPHRGNKGL